MARQARPLRRNARIDAHVLESLWEEQAARHNPYDGIDALDDFLDFAEAVEEDNARSNPGGAALTELMGLFAGAMQKHKIDGAIDVDFGTQAQCNKVVDTRPEQWAPFSHWLWFGTKKAGLVTSSEHPKKPLITCWYEPASKKFRCVKSEWDAASSKLKQTSINAAVAEIAKHMREVSSKTVEFTKEQQQTYKRTARGGSSKGASTKQGIVKELATILASVGEGSYDGALAEAKDAYNRAIAIQGKPPDKEFVRQVKLLYENIVSNLPPEHRGKASWDEVASDLAGSALAKKLEILRSGYSLLHPGEIAKWSNEVIAAHDTSRDKLPVHVYVDADYLGPKGTKKTGRLLVGQAQGLEGKQFKPLMLKIPGVKTVYVSPIKGDVKFIAEV